MKDSKLIKMLKDRKQEGINILTSKYGPLIRYIIAPILTDYREHEECFSDVIYRIWDKIDTYDESKGCFNTWISTITRNITYNRARSVNRQVEMHVIPEELVSKNRSPEEEIIYQERLTDMHNLLDELSAKDKILLYRKYYYMQSTEQIAAESGLTQRDVEGRLYRIKKKLRGKIQ